MSYNSRGRHAGGTSQLRNRIFAQHAFTFAVIALVTAICPFAARAESSAIQETLPLDVQVDLLMTELSDLLKKDDNQGIVELIPRIRALEIEIPDSLNFLEASALFKTGRALEARDRLLAYLANTGREGKYYQQATELLLKVKEKAEAEERARKAELEREEERKRQAALKALVLRTREAQRYLDQLGFPIKETGELDEDTREAIAVYQVRNNLTVNAEVTDELMKKLKSSVPDTHNCDALTRYSHGPDSWDLPLGQIASNVAIPTCNEALRQYPDAIRFQVEYARALVAAERTEDAMNAIDHAARLGYPEASMLVGRMHEAGLLSEKGRPDYANALRWYRMAADKAYPEAQRRIGHFYLEGLGVKRDYDAAVVWFQKTADQGYAPGQVDLGLLYSEGKGVNRDYTAALSWFTKAARAGYPLGQFYLGDAYERGKGVQKDKDTAISWYTKAGEQGHEESLERAKKLGG